MRSRRKWSLAVTALAAAVVRPSAAQEQSDPFVIIDGQSRGFYNQAIQNALDGTDPGFPADGDPSIPDPAEPDLSAASDVLGDWLADPPDLSVPWTGPQGIPSTWTIGTETAVLYPFGDDETSFASITIRIGVDNGAFVWLDGVYIGGQVEPGGVSPGELTLTVKDVPAGEHFLQIIREDHGRATGFSIEVLATLPNPFVFDAPRAFLTEDRAAVEATGDFDANGFADVVAVLPDAGAVPIFLNEGVTDGAWDGFTTLPPIVVGAQPLGVAVADFDLDDDLDIAVTLSGDNAIRILANDGTMDGAFTPEPPIPVGAVPTSIAAADFTSDGAPDVAVALAGAGEVVVLANDESPGGGGVNVSFTLIETVAATGVSGGLCPEDIDEDKDIDLVIALRDVDAVRVVALDDGLEVASTIVEVGSRPVDVTGGDFDGNSYMDFGSANSGDGTVSIALNDGPDQPGGAPVFRPAQSEPVGPNPTSIDAVDVDADGDPDIVVTADDPDLGPSVRVLENQGGPGKKPGEDVAFSPPFTFDVGAEPNYVVGEDLDDDGLDDLVTANTDPESGGGSITVLINESACPGDLEPNGNVGFDDLLFMIGQWGPCPSETCPADLDGSGVVGFFDLTALLDGWGPCAR